jgi:hypothetical protein
MSKQLEAQESRSAMDSHDLARRSRLAPVGGIAVDQEGIGMD